MIHAIEPVNQLQPECNPFYISLFTSRNSRKFVSAFGPESGREFRPLPRCVTNFKVGIPGPGRPLQQLPSHTTFVQWQNKNDLKIDKGTGHMCRSGAHGRMGPEIVEWCCSHLHPSPAPPTLSNRSWLAGWMAGFNFETIANWQSKSSKTVKTAAANNSRKASEKSQHGIFPRCGRVCGYPCVPVCVAKAFDLNWVCENFVDLIEATKLAPSGTNYGPTTKQASGRGSGAFRTYLTVRAVLFWLKELQLLAGISYCAGVYCSTIPDISWKSSVFIRSLFIER